MAAIEERDARPLLRRADLAAGADPARAHAGLRRRVPGEARVTRADVLLVSLGGTAGLREADAELAASLRRAGATVAVAPRRAAARVADVRAASSSPGRARRARRPRRGDRASTARARSSTRRPRRRCSRPRPGAIRFDAPAAGNRPGRHGIWQRPVERRRMRDAPLLVPWSEGGLAEAPSPHARRARRARPGRAFRARRRTRDIAAITYGANPSKKGLDRVLAAWDAARRRARSSSSPASTSERAAGCEPAVAAPAASRFAGMLAREDYRALLRRARVFVCAPRREDYGIAQLEALADGCQLVTTPSPGPYAALPLARQLDSRLVGGIAEGIRTALDHPSPDYAARGAELLAPWQPEAVDRLVREQLLPRLVSRP